jgi:ABC-type branched-subunit amino acid transport system ATPase component/ABC-type branched-subunit amino acid transport system permease subunit
VGAGVVTRGPVHHRPERGVATVGRQVVIALGSGIAVIVAAGLTPGALVPAVGRVAVLALLGLGAWLSVQRFGTVDLATGAAAGAGAYLGGVGIAVLDLPPLLGLPAGMAAGGLVTAIVGAMTARTGRALGSLASLAVGVGLVGVFASWALVGGPAGFHAIPFLAGSPRVDLAIVLVAVGVAWGAATRVSRSVLAARASVAARAPVVAAALGRRPGVDAAVGAAAAGAALGRGGVLDAALSGSVRPAAYGLGLSAALALAVLVGGRVPAGGVLGTMVVLGPAIALPGAPIVGDAPLLVTGVIGVALLAIRPRGLLGPAADGRSAEPVAEPAAPPSPATEPFVLDVSATPLPAGGETSFEVAPGEVVALAGPNGAGKSTVLARVAGQLPDGGGVRFGSRSAPRGPVRRARVGVARSWQRPPPVDPTDAIDAAVLPDGGAAARRWAQHVLGEAAQRPAGQDLVRAAARRPSLVLLDEPGADLPADRVTAFLRGLADGGAAVLVAEHRPEVLAVADRVVPVGLRTED